MQAIRTRYFGPTNFRGSRIQAKCEAKSIFVSYDHALNLSQNHKVACETLVRKVKWDKHNFTPIVGGLFNGDYYWVFTNDDSGSGRVSPTTFDGVQS